MDKKGIYASQGNNSSLIHAGISFYAEIDEKGRLQKNTEQSPKIQKDEWLYPEAGRVPARRPQRRHDLPMGEWLSFSEPGQHVPARRALSDGGQSTVDRPDQGPENGNGREAGKEKLMRTEGVHLVL